MAPGFWRRTALTVCWTLFACAQAAAAGFSVSPLRLDLGLTARSGVIEVANAGTQKINFQLEAMEWTQDATGKDLYAGTRDLIFFPKIMTLEPGEEGIVRVGIRPGTLTTEKTYRLFIEELPGAKKEPQTSGAQINFLIRFGVPIFSAPIQPQDSLDIETLGLRKGALELAVKNTGNRHQIVKGVQLKGLDAAGNQVYSLDIADRYLLAGTRKSYTSTIGGEQCQKIAVLAVEIKTDRLSEIRKLDVTRAMCP